MLVSEQMSLVFQMHQWRDHSRYLFLDSNIQAADFSRLTGETKVVLAPVYNVSIAS